MLDSTKALVKAIDIHRRELKADTAYTNGSGSCRKILLTASRIYLSEVLSILANNLCVLPDSVFEYCGGIRNVCRSAERQKLLLSKGVVPGTQHIH